MCRFIAYLGKPILLDEILFKTPNSLIKQSIHAKESKVILNGDGFGLGWYNHDIDLMPGLFKSTKPAWSDENLKHLSEKIRTTCFMGHVRAASVGSVAEHNCHPFRHQSFICMHNGTIGGFTRLKRYLRRELCDEFYDWIKGDTDTEHFFALFWDTVKSSQLSGEISHLAECMNQALKRLQEIQEKLEITEPSTINASITNGNMLLAMRYRSDQGLPPTLHYAKGRQYEPSGKG